MSDANLDIFIPEKYRPSGNNKKVFPSIYNNIESEGKVLNFDIYDYEMLFNDQPTQKLIREGKTIGCFYIESPGMRSLLKKLDCHTFEMLVAASSIIRPGVAESGMMQEFIERHKNPSKREYLVPEMKKYLSETYGLMVYQEDVIKIAHHIAGLSLEEADLLRRAMSGKMRSSTAMKFLKDKFFNSCKEKHLFEYIIRALWHQIESFAGYAFCKAHSASFALLSFQVAYLKQHYPAEFMANVLSNGGGFYSHSVYIWECKRMGLQVKLPCINTSNYEYTGCNGVVQIGLMAIKNFSHNTAVSLISERKKYGGFKSLRDFMSRVYITREEVYLLIRCGALGYLKQTRPELMRLADIYLKHKQLLAKNDMFEYEMNLLAEEVRTYKQYSVTEICKAEYEIFGYMVTRHPLYFYKEELKKIKYINAAEMNKFNGQNIKMVGWYMTSKRIKTKSGEIMKFLSLEDMTNTFEAVIFPNRYKELAELTMSMGPYLVEGIVDTVTGNNLIVKKMQILSGETVLSATLKDSVENKWYGDNEKISEAEFEIAKKLNSSL